MQSFICNLSSAEMYSGALLIHYRPVVTGLGGGKLKPPLYCHIMDSVLLIFNRIILRYLFLNSRTPIL